MSLSILVTLPQGKVFDRHFTPQVLTRLEKLGDVRLNPLGRQYTPQELRDALRGVDVAITHWGTPCFSADVLQNADKLSLLAHGAGTVAYVASEALYDKNVRVTTANSVMARFVAEGVLGYFIMGLRGLDRAAAAMHGDLLWKTDTMIDSQRSLFGLEIGLIGFGAVARELTFLLAPFGCRVKVYDPFVSKEALAAYPGTQAASFEEALACPLVSVHAAKTPDTRHLIDARALSMLPDSTVFVNTSRGSLVDEDALVRELKSGRISAVLDVYETEPLPLNHPLRSCENALLLPHLAADCAKAHMTNAIIDEIERFMRKEALTMEISREHFRGMTQG